MSSAWVIISALLMGKGTMTNSVPPLAVSSYVPSLSSRSPLGDITWLAETKQFGKQLGIS